MTQDEKWKKNYEEVEGYMDTYHRNPSKHRVEDHLMLNWLKHQRKLMNRAALKPERVEAFKRLLGGLYSVEDIEAALKTVKKELGLK